MNVFDGTTTEELAARYNSLMEKYVILAKDIAPLLDKFGKYKKEIELISLEFLNRRL